MDAKDVNLINYVNFEMREINNLSDELYESMIDQENDSVLKVCDSLIKKLTRDICLWCQKPNKDS